MASKIEDARILIADDDFISREVLKTILQKWGYTVECCSDGKTALEELKKEKSYAVAILDWIMPFYNGIDICKYFKNSRKTDTYLILLSANNNLDDVIAGLDSGANDYVTKPFEPKELHARIRVGIRVFNLKRNVSRYASKMEALANERAMQLVHADRLSTIGTLSAGMAHEINNPLSFIEGNINFLSDCWPVIQKSLSFANDNGIEDSARINICLEEFQNVINGMLNGVNRITKIIKSLKLYARKGDSEKIACSLQNVIEQSLELCKNRLKYGIDVKFDKSVDAEVFADAQLLIQVFVNLLVNAADALENRADAQIQISIDTDPEMVFIMVADNGPGFTELVMSKLFSPFFTTKDRAKGTGLGLSICQGIIEEHQGTINAENRESGGARFVISLPHWKGELS